MRPTTFKAGILASTLLAGVGTLSPAFAQDVEETDAQAPAEAAQPAAPADEIVVTGSRIRQANLVSTSPVTQVTAEELDVRGVVRVEDMINTLPQAFAAQGSNISNGASGTATVDLRGLGPQRTLVLVNGRRLPYGSVRTVAPDLNQIPGALVERVEVLTGGASAVYGSDAIAGVVNFIMIDDFEGVRIDTQYSFFQHKNDNDEIQSIIREFAADNPAQYQVPEENVTDGEAFEITGVIGANTPDGRGNVTVYAGYRTVDPVLQSDRDYSACAFGTTGVGGSDFTCAGSLTAGPGANILYAESGIDGQALNLPSQFSVVGNGFGPVTNASTFNFAPFNYYQRNDERYTLGAFANYEVNDHAEAYTELMFMDDRTVAQIAPSGIFGGGITGTTYGGINCDNPFLSAQQQEFLCTSNGLSTASPFAPGDDGVLGTGDDVYLGGDVALDTFVLRRNVEGGPRQDDLRHTSYRGVVGLRGDLFAGFTYDVYASYANVHRAENYRNEFSVSRAAKALNVVSDPVTGNPVCVSALDPDGAGPLAPVDPNCVPYNVFDEQGVTQAALDYLQIPLLEDGNTIQQIVSASVTGDLGQYGLQSPWASTGLAIAVGTEYRRDYLETLPDANFQAGEGFGQGGPTLPVSGSTDVYEWYAEARMPLIEGMAFADLLAVEGAYRFSDYGTVSTDAYKLAADWSPTQDVRFRASYQRAVRAPNVVELFTTQQIGLFDLSQGENDLYDPCAGADPAATLEECMRTGVTAEQYGNIADNPAGQFNQLFGGNPDLDPEKSDTYTIGAVITPSFLPGLNLSVDYFDITVDDLIGGVGAALALNSCLDTGAEFFCSLVNRGAGGTLWLGTTGYIVNTNLNTGSLETSGVDLQATYGVDLDEFGMANAGGLAFDFVGTWLDTLITQPLPTSTAEETYDCVGLYGGACFNPKPEWRHKLRVSWQSPWNFDLSGTWRYYGSVDIAASSDQPALSGSFAEVQATLEEQNYFDLAANIQATETLRFRAGVNNVFDSEPPLSAATISGNTFPQVYDALGRYIFAGATVDF